MSPHKECDTARDISDEESFFKSVDLRSYPATQEKARPWQKLVSAQKKREYGTVEKMVVVCSQYHDHGM
jgi:hypothetical protein